MASQKAGGWATPYKFNGKELDDETGMYYYGARYYDPRLSMWHGVDPLAERGPQYSPYTYTFNNPIRYIDPDGRWAGPSPLGHAIPAGIKARSILKAIGEVIVNFAGSITQIGDLHVANNLDRAGKHEQAANVRKGAENAIKNVAFDLLTGYGMGKIFKGTALAFASSRNMTLGETSKAIIGGLGDDVSIIVAKSGDDLRYLNSMGADAVYMGGQGNTGTIILREGSSKSALVEEAIHHGQRMKHGSKYFYNNRTSLEIEAQDMLINIAKKEKWGANEISRLEAAKAAWVKLQKEGI
jgi:RHS repeat-associated protein